MNEPIQLWLRNRIRRNSILNFGTFLLALVGGLLVSFLTFWLTYAGLMMANGLVELVGDLLGYREISITHSWRLWLSGLFFLLLYWECARRPLSELGNYEGDFEEEKYRYHDYLDGWGYLISFSRSSRVSSKMITEILYFGPRLIQMAIQNLQDIVQLQRLNTPHIAGVMHYLAVRDSAVSREELTAYYSTADARRLLTDLRRIGGVVFLKKGISLTTETREELQTLLRT